MSYAGAGWKTGYIGEPHRVYKSSIKIAADGTEYIAFGGGHPVYINDPPGDDLMLAKRSPGEDQWIITAVDKDPDAEVGLDPSLALDSSGHPKISYYDSTNGNLKYASYNGTSWTIEIVDARPVGGNKVGMCPSLALDSNDAPRISYYDNDSLIKYASYNGSTWDIEVVYYTSNKGFHNSLALDSNNNPHISYYQSSNAELRYSYFDGSTWDHQLVDNGGTGGDDVGQYNSIALTSTDQPRISYFDDSNNDLKYASWNGASWDLSLVYATGDVGEYSSLVLNSVGWYTISYYDRTNDSLVVTSFNGTFGVGLIYDAAGGDYTSLTLDTDGKPAVSYRINKTGVLKIASHRPSITTAIIAAEGNPYISNRALAINPAGKPGIAYYNSAGINQDIKYALYNGSTWDIQIVDAHLDNRYIQPSLAFDSNGKPIIAYLDSTNYELKLASWSGTSWVFDIVDNTDMTGKRPSIAIDSNNNPHISYYSVSNNGLDYNLKYAVWTGSDWDIETIEDIGDWTKSSIGLTSANKPRIAFYNRTTETLRLAVKENSNWTVSTVEAVGTIGWCQNTSLAIDNNDNIHISYFNYTNADLKYARYSSGILNTQSVDTTNFVGMNNSIALNSSGRPGISYYDSTTDQYKYAAFNGSSWDLQIVAGSEGNSSSSVAIDSNDRIWIAYRDELKDDLKFVVSSKATFLPAIFQLLLSD